MIKFSFFIEIQEKRYLLNNILFIMKGRTTLGFVLELIIKGFNSEGGNEREL